MKLMPPAKQAGQAEKMDFCTLTRSELQSFWHNFAPYSFFTIEMLIQIEHAIRCCVPFGETPSSTFAKSSRRKSMAQSHDQFRVAQEIVVGRELSSNDARNGRLQTSMSPEMVMKCGDLEDRWRSLPTCEQLLPSTGFFHQQHSLLVVRHKMKRICA